ncbi:MAG: hypothetical protein AB1458_14335 [Bacteroidota bacterium]
MKKTISLTFILFASVIFIASCSKGPGEGGKAAIKGKVFVRNYDATFTQLYASYYAQDEDVYIIYGDDATFSRSVKTNYDGTYVFPYLRPGKYKVFTYSKDTVKYLNGQPNYSGNVVASKTVHVLKEVEIVGKKDTTVVPDLEIVK